MADEDEVDARADIECSVCANAKQEIKRLRKALEAIDEETWSTCRPDTVVGRHSLKIKDLAKAALDGRGA